jgi:hypothetical protein
MADAPTPQDAPKAICPDRLMKEGESHVAHEALKAYFDQGDSRSIASVAKQLSKSATLVHRWARRFNWNERIDVANAEAQVAFRRALDRQMEAFVNRFIGQRIKVADGNTALALKAQKKAMEIMDYMPVKDQQVSKDGKTIIIKASPNIRMSDAPRLIMVANIAMNQADQVANPKRLGRNGQKADGSPLPDGQEAPYMEIFLDAGDGTPRPLSEMPVPDELDPNYHPEDDDGSTPTP